MIKEYRLLNRYQYYFVATTIAPYILFILFIWQSAYGWSGLCFVLPISLLVIIAILNNFNKLLNYPFQRILLSEQGIEYAKPYLSFETKWKSIEKIGFHWSIVGRLEGLYIPQNLINIEVGNNWELLSFFKRVFIPLSCFAGDWRDSELGGQIKQYAPHLFNQEDTIRVNS
jgi:hypothetical protein